MKNYPDLAHLDQVDHLIFDVGYAYGLLSRVEGLLQRVMEALPDTILAEDADQLLETLEDFTKGRLQYRHQIYAAATEAANRACGKP